MNDEEQRLAGIRAYRALGDRVGTAGQPSVEQFSWIRGAGFEVVVNLALPTSDHAVANEGSLVAALGMAYVHLPVNFQAPTAEDFSHFCGIMKAFQGRRIFVHCALNMRVSAFLFLYRVLQEQVPVPVAVQDLRAIWEPDGVWREFMVARLGERGLEFPPASASDRETAA